MELDYITLIWIACVFNWICYLDLLYWDMVENPRHDES